jgi:hypothetical protein
MAEHLSEACRTSKTLDHTTDRFVGATTDMELEYPIRARVTRLLFVEFWALFAGRHTAATRQSNTCLILARSAVTFSA